MQTTSVTVNFNKYYLAFAYLVTGKCPDFQKTRKQFKGIIMISSIFLYVIVAISSYILPVRYNSPYPKLVTIFYAFNGAAIITAFFHSDHEYGTWMVVGLGLVGNMAYHYRYKLLKKGK